MNKTLIEDIKQKHPGIRLVMASKYLKSNEFSPYMEAGIHEFGESRVSAFLQKAEALEDVPITWHFLGTLQSKKVKTMINKIDMLHSLDRISLAKEIEKRRDEPLSCLIQVNISGEESKHGAEPKKLFSFLKALEAYPMVEVIGLMGIAKRTENDALIREQFKTLRTLRDEVSLEYPACKELSMGMSEDYQIAIEEGATILRLGRILIKEGLL